ncbi:hypothetical protein D3C85_1477420 [compost metagenome]
MDGLGLVHAYLQLVLQAGDGAVLLLGDELAGGFQLGLGDLHRFRISLLGSGLLRRLGARAFQRQVFLVLLALDGVKALVVVAFEQHDQHVALILGLVAKRVQVFLVAVCHALDLVVRANGHLLQLHAHDLRASA